MKQALLLFLFGVGFYFATEAQNRSPDIISPAGGIDQARSISLEWTLGEFAVSTLYSDDIMITEGFHQPTLTVTRMDDLTNKNTNEKDLEIRVYPNPVVSSLQIKTQFDEPTEVEIVLLDIKGKQHYRQLIDQHSKTYSLDMQQYAPGVYILKCLEKTGTMLQSFKVIKIK